jgi:hypothetical protein
MSVLEADSLGNEPEAFGSQPSASYCSSEKANYVFMYCVHLNITGAFPHFSV